MKDKIILELESKYFYQLLVQSVRYACSRNNHLEPDGTFENLKMVLPIYYEQDNEGAIATTKQICEEVISDLVIIFSKGDDDEYKNRENYLSIISWLLDFINKNIRGEWKPYNYDNYLTNLELDNKKQWYVKDLDTDERYNVDLLSTNEYMDFIMHRIIKSEVATYHKNIERWEEDGSIRCIKLYFKEPIELKLIILKEELEND